MPGIAVAARRISWLPRHRHRLSRQHVRDVDAPRDRGLAAAVDSRSSGKRERGRRHDHRVRGCDAPSRMRPPSPQRDDCASRLRTAARQLLERSSSKHRLTVSAIELLMTPQDLGGRGLLLERFLGLVEQPHVLDRDHRLVGEGLQQRDLVCR